jgi:hypothetical protein
MKESRNDDNGTNEKKIVVIMKTVLITGIINY